MILRLEGVAKMGYYRTPDNATKQILRRLEPKNPGDRLVLGDPCCGEGLALREAADYLKSYGPVITYGIEPDEKRAEASKKRLDYVIKDGYENATITNQAFSLWWFNPPYDSATAGEYEKTERKEVIFLRNTFKYIAPHGVLICIVPQHVLGKLAPILVNRFYDLTVERFDDTEFDIFKQVVVFGYRKPPGSAPGSKEDREQFALIGRADPKRLPSLDRVPQKIYYLPAGVVPKIFHGEAVDMEKVKEVLPLSPVRKIVGGLVAPKMAHAKLGTPLVSLKPGQLANIIAAGALDGVIGRDENRHLLIGFTNRHKRVDVETNESGVVTTYETTEYVSGARLFTADGRHILLSESATNEAESS